MRASQQPRRSRRALEYSRTSVFRGCCEALVLAISSALLKVRLVAIASALRMKFCRLLKWPFFVAERPFLMKNSKLAFKGCIWYIFDEGLIAVVVVEL